MSIPSWARKGVKVVCVDAYADLGEWPLVKDEVYVIDRVQVYQAWEMIGFVGPHSNTRVGLVLKGVSNPFDADSAAFAITRFRPLITQEDDLATHFEQYLKTDHRATERERA